MKIEKKLGIIACGLTLIIISMFLLTWISTARQKDDSLVVNLAGRQRMLIQKMTAEILDYHIIREKTDSEFTKSAENIRNTMKIFDLTLSALKDSGPAPLSQDLKTTEYRECPQAKEPVYTQLGKVADLWKIYSGRIEAFLNSREQADARLAWLVGNSQPILRAMNKVVFMMQEQSEKKVSLLLRAQLAGIFFGICFVILTIFITLELAGANKKLRIEVLERKQAEDELRRSEARYRELVENANSIILRMDPKGNVTFFNEFAQKFFGFTEEEILGNSVIGTIVPPKDSMGRDLEKMIEEIGKHPEKFSNNKNENIRRSGERVWVAWTNKPIFNQAGQIIEILCVGNDITGHKQVEDELRKSEEEYRLLVENINDALYITDEKGLFIYMSPVIEKISGYHPSELIGRPFSDFLHPEDLPRIFENFQRVLSGKNGQGEYRILCKSGKYLWVKTNSQPFVKGNQVVGLRGVLNDVSERKLAQEALQEAYGELENRVRERTAELAETNRKLRKEISERKQAEETLQESEEQLRTVLESSVEGIITINEQGIVESFNPAAERMFGYSASEILGKNISMLVPEPHHSEHDGYLKNYLETNKKKIIGTRCEVDAQHKDGTIFPIELSVSEAFLVGRRLFTGIVHDIIERRKTEEMLRRLSTAVEQTAESVVITDLGGNIEYVNPSFGVITGYMAWEVLGRNMNILKSNRHGSDYYHDLWKTLGDGEVWKGQFINKKKNGDIYHQKAVISPVRNAGGQIVNYVAVLRDITQEVLLEEQLRHSQKMESIGQLAGGVAHDFNNALASIMGYAEMIAEMEDLPVKARKGITVIEKASLRASGITRQLLAFSRKQEPNLQVMNLNEAVDQTTTFLRKTIGLNITIENKLSHNLGMVRADEGQIQQVLMNLCLNARDAIEKKGSILIETSNLEVDKDFARAQLEAQPGPYVTVSVTDNGQGMDKETLQRIFDPFFTTKEIGKGTGLGLSIVYGIVKSHCGFINVSSKPGRGTTFKVYLPRTTARQDRKRKNGKPVRRGNETILVVDDDKLVLELASDLLENYGYRCITAGNGGQAVELYRREYEKIDLVLLDFAMPETNGVEIFEQMRKINPGIVAIITSGFQQEFNKRELLKTGFSAFITKPFQTRQLAGAVRNALDQTAAERESG